VVRVVEGSGAASIVSADRRSSIRVGHGTSHGVRRRPVEMNTYDTNHRV
jgi:hypothetical protein